MGGPFPRSGAGYSDATQFIGSPQFPGKLPPPPGDTTVPQRTSGSGAVLSKPGGVSVSRRPASSRECRQFPGSGAAYRTPRHRASTSASGPGGSRPSCAAAASPTRGPDSGTPGGPGPLASATRPEGWTPPPSAKPSSNRNKALIAGQLGRTCRGLSAGGAARGSSQPKLLGGSSDPGLQGVPRATAVVAYKQDHRRPERTGPSSPPLAPDMSAGDHRPDDGAISQAQSDSVKSALNGPC